MFNLGACPRIEAVGSLFSDRLLGALKEMDLISVISRHVGNPGHRDIVILGVD